MTTLKLAGAPASTEDALSEILEMFRPAPPAPADCVLTARRVIEGKTYNTDTSTLVAYLTEDEDNGDSTIWNLYLSRGGQFFEVEQTTKTWYHRDEGERRSKVRKDVTPLDDEAARAWPEKYNAEIVADLFALLDEESAPTEEKLLLRMSSALKAKLAAKAKAAGVSMNEFITRCIERDAG